jgi:hypothetical protein
MGKKLSVKTRMKEIEAIINTLEGDISYLKLAKESGHIDHTPFWLKCLIYDAKGHLKILKKGGQS